MADSNLTRIVYVEPNYLHGSSDNGVDLPVPYDDLCIAIDLIAEVKSRFSVNTQDAREAVVVQWTSGSKDVSFLKGIHLDANDRDNSYLSTFFTDIEYENVKGAQVVEGLGISSVDISFDSWYTPTVTIKFVDVRGSSVFAPNQYGAEVDKSQYVTSAEMYKCFFTFPYPRFRLLVKGFYGKAVTYQLAVVSFNASFNSQTGNFEAVAQFIGDKYALLTDVKFQYLIAAPYDTYYGKVYWDSHVQSPEWALSDGSQMPTLLDLLKKLGNAVPEIREKLNTDPISVENSVVSEELNLLNKIKELYQNVVTEITAEICGEQYTEGKLVAENTKQMVFGVRSSSPLNYTQSFANLWQSFKNAVEEYNSISRYADRYFTSDMTPFGVLSKTITRNTTHQAVKAFDIHVNSDGEKKIRVVNPGNSTKTDKGRLSTIQLNERKTIDSDLVDDVMDATVRSSTTTSYENLFIFDTNGFEGEVNKRIESANNKTEAYRREVADYMKTVTKDTIGFTPSVYNMSKIIFAHLETFLASMYQCVNTIASQMKTGGRSLSDDFHLTLDATDLAYNKNQGTKINLPPFPLILDHGVSTKYSGKQDESLYVNGWIGDKNPDAQEKQLVEGYTKSIEKQVQYMEETRRERLRGSSATPVFPICASDLRIGNTPYAFSATTDVLVDETVTHLGARFYLAYFGLTNTPSYTVDTKLLEQLGELEAYNFYSRGMSKSELDENFLQRIKEGSAGLENIEGILVNSQDTAKDFAVYSENTKRYRYHHEFVDIEGDGQVVCDFYTLGEFSYLRSYSSDYHNARIFLPGIFNTSSLTKKFMYDEHEDLFTLPEPVDNVASGYVVYNEETLFDAYPQYDANEYRNLDMFSILRGEDARSVYNYYEILKAGKIEIGDYQADGRKFDLVTKYIFNLDYESYMKEYYNMGLRSNRLICQTDYVLFQDTIQDDTDTRKLWPTSINENTVIPTSVVSFRKWKTNVPDAYSVAMNTFLGNEGGINSVMIPDISVYGNNNSQSLFMSELYYMQNCMLESEVDNRPAYQLRSLGAKAILFLSSLLVNHYAFRFGKKAESYKEFGVNFVPYCSILYLGALLWRDRYCEENGLDDIFVFDMSRSDIRDVDGISFFEKKTRNGTPFTVRKMKVTPYETNGTKDSDRRTALTAALGQFINTDTWGNAVTYFYKGDDVYSLIPSIKNTLIEQFLRWLNDSASGFMYIMQELELKKSNGSAMNACDIRDFINDFCLANNMGEGEFFDENGRLVDEESFQVLRDTVSSVSTNLLANYGSFKMDETITFHALLRPDTGVQNVLKQLVTEWAVVVPSVRDKIMMDGNLETNSQYVYARDLRTFCRSFLDTLVRIRDSAAETADDDDPADLDTYRDVNISMYMYLKGVYDKWLTGDSLSSYTVANFFDENFIFVDSFYRDIGNDLIIDCDYFFRLCNDITADRSLFSVIADIYAKHGMVFTPISNYNDWSEEENVNSMFKPLAYNEMNRMERNNKFLCMYMHKPAEHLNIAAQNSGYGFKEDGFDVYDQFDPLNLDVQPAVFKSGTLTRENGKPYGYRIPTFGVAFSKQNQSYFQNINVGMSNPTPTEYSIQAVYNIANVGANSVTKVQFVGQDLFSVWASYSYECEVEMLGDAQIQPLMYFQLMNIPMFNGTYIVTQVSHHITQGNMKTVFKGVKLCKFGQPFNSMPFAQLGVATKNPANTDTLRLSSKTYGKEGSPLSSYGLQYPYNDPSRMSPEMTDGCLCDTTLPETAWSGMDASCRSLFNAIRKTVSDQGYSWTVCLLVGYTEEATGTFASDHKDGYAFDIGIKDGDRSNLGIVFDIISTTYSDYVKKVTLVYESAEILSVLPDYMDRIHVSCLAASGNKEIFVGYMDDGECLNANRFLLENRNGRMVAKPFRYLRDENQDEWDTNADGTDMEFYDVALNLEREQPSIFKKNEELADKYLSFIPNTYKQTAAKRFPKYFPDNLSSFRKVFSSFLRAPDIALMYYFRWYGMGSDGQLIGESMLSRNKSYAYTTEPRCKDIGEFRDRISALGRKYDFNPNWLMIVMSVESGLDPSAANPRSSATGLIQFMAMHYYDNWHLGPDQHTARLVLQKMDATEQLDCVDRYIAQYYGDPSQSGFTKTIEFKNALDIYLCVFSPATLNNRSRNMNTVLYSSSSNPEAYEANKVIDRDGNGSITLGDLKDWMFGQAASRFNSSSEEQVVFQRIMDSTVY